MTWGQIEGTSRTMRDALRERWGMLTDDDLDAIDGRRAPLIDALQRRYGVTRSLVEREIAEFEQTLGEQVRREELI